jgi:hypothetical protein
MKPHRGALILTFGILGLVCCVLFGVAAWVMGNTDLREMQAGQMDPAGQGITQAGKICGIVSVAILAVAIVVYGVLLMLGIVAGVASGH